MAPAALSPAPYGVRLLPTRLSPIRSAPRRRSFSRPTTTTGCQRRRGGACGTLTRRRVRARSRPPVLAWFAADGLTHLAGRERCARNRVLPPAEDNGRPATVGSRPRRVPSRRARLSGPAMVAGRQAWSVGGVRGGRPAAGHRFAGRADQRRQPGQRARVCRASGRTRARATCFVTPNTMRSRAPPLDIGRQPLWEPGGPCPTQRIEPWLVT